MLHSEGDHVLNLLPYGGGDDGEKLSDEDDNHHVGSVKLMIDEKLDGGTERNLDGVEEVNWIVRSDVEKERLNLSKMSEVEITGTDKTLELAYRSHHKELENFDADSETKQLAKDSALGVNEESELEDPHVIEPVISKHSEFKSKLPHLVPHKSCCMVPDSLFNDPVIVLDELKTRPQEADREWTAHSCTSGNVYHGSAQLEDPTDVIDSNMKEKIDENLPAFSIYKNIDTSVKSYELYQCHGPVDPGVIFPSTGYEPSQKAESDLKDPELEKFQPDVSSVELGGNIVGIDSPVSVHVEQTGNNSIIINSDDNHSAEVDDDLVKLDDNKTEFIFVEEISCFDISLGVAPENPDEVAALYEYSKVCDAGGEATQALRTKGGSHNCSPEEKETDSSTLGNYGHGVESNDPQMDKVVKPEHTNDFHEEINLSCKGFPPTGLEMNRELSVALPCLDDDTKIVTKEQNENGDGHCEKTSTEEDVVVKCILTEDIGVCSQPVTSTSIGSVNLFEAKVKAHKNVGEHEPKGDWYLIDKGSLENVSDLDEISNAVSYAENTSTSNHFDQNSAGFLETSIQFAVGIDNIHIVANTEAQVMNIATETNASKHLHEELNTNRINQAGASNTNPELSFYEGQMNSSMGIQTRDSGTSEESSDNDYSGKASIVHHQFSEEEIDPVEKQQAHVIPADLDVQILDSDTFEESNDRYSGEISNTHHQFFEDEINIFLLESQQHGCRSDSSSGLTVPSTRDTKEPSAYPILEDSQGTVPQKPRNVDSIYSVGGVPSEQNVDNDVFKLVSSTEIEPVMNAKQRISPGGQSLSGTNPEQEYKVRQDEEKIMDLSNWSTSEALHAPLKNLLNLTSKQKGLNLLDWNMSIANEHAIQHPSQGHHLTKTATSTTAAQPVARRIIYKEWNSPARLPINKNGKGKPRGKSQWVPFMCCSYVDN